MPWVYDPQAGGVKIPPAVQERTRQRILKHAEKHYAGKYSRLDLRFRGQFCYIDAYKEPDVPPNSYLPPGMTRAEYVERQRNTPIHLCRLRYFGKEDEWTLAFYTYSHEKYEPCVFSSGGWHGTPEEALDIGAVYLTE